MHTISSRVFDSMQKLNVQELSSYAENEIRPVLPSLVRMSLLSPLDNTESSMDSRKQILALLVEIEIVNNIVAFLQVNYYDLETDLKKELQIRQKVNTSTSFHTTGLQNGIALGFERADVSGKVKVVLSEIFNIQLQLMEVNTMVYSELFENGIYLDEVIDIICIALAELPSLLNVQELVDILIYVNNGKQIICSIVANFPDSYKDVINSLVMNCEEDSLEGKSRLSILIALSQMNSTQALSTRATCIDLMKVPSLMLKLCMKYPQDLIAFLSGMLLGNDQLVRSWLAVFFRSSQKRRGDALGIVREELIRQLKELVNMSLNIRGFQEYTVQGAALLRLYCAMRGIAGIKFSEEEINLIMQLITSRPEPTPSGIRFVSLALCMLIACPSLLLNLTLENKAIEWMHWLIKEDSYMGSSLENSSFGEMLLLIAIHFHSNQISAIAELICASLAMKIPIRPNSMNRIKQIFTQELFTEQVVAAHAVKVPVTLNLSANTPGYLPVHCIHQLLKSRTFLKHKIAIKSWIYKQICNCKKPLHPVMPAVIEVFVNSLIVPNPSGKLLIDHLHRPFTEDEILRIFKTRAANNNNVDLLVSGNSSLLNESARVDKFHKGECVEVTCELTAQLLILYYLVQYEDTRLVNMSNLLVNGRKPKVYTNQFFSELPMKYLLQGAQRYQHEYLGLFHPLLRLLISNFPHLSMVDDWLESNNSGLISTSTWVCGYEIQNQLLMEAFDELTINPSKILRVLKAMLKSPSTKIWKFATIFVTNINKILEKNVPRLIKELYKKVWLRLNSVFPRKLWIMTISAVIPMETVAFKSSYFHENILDPLNVLRCIQRAFRTPDVLAIILRILQASLAASSAQLNIHIQKKPIIDKNGQVQTDIEREELKTSFIASQESTAVHILLEGSAIDVHDSTKLGSLWRLQEIRGIVCSYIHQVFISEPSLAKLVHFQTYPRSLLRMTVQGVPSMHICIDFLHEIIGMPEMKKQIFSIDLTSHLVLRYAIPKSLSIAKFCINTFILVFGLLSADAKTNMFCKMFSSLVRFSEAFPVLLDDCINFLMQAGRSLCSQDTIESNSTFMHSLIIHYNYVSKPKLKNSQETPRLITCIESAFDSLVERAISDIKLY